MTESRSPASLRSLLCESLGRGLIAIVGSTGAGKSSILEAITYGLYSARASRQDARRAGDSPIFSLLDTDGSDRQLEGI